jgi:membrane dipeptidase
VDRRDFLLRSAAVIGTAGVARELGADPARPSATRRDDDPGTAFRRAIVIDTLVPDGPSLDAAAGIGAGYTACVLDMAMAPRSYERGSQAIKEWNEAFARPGSRLLKVTSLADLHDAKARKMLGIILACQDASVLGMATKWPNESYLDNLKWFHGQGLRVLQLAHNDRNMVAEGYREPANAGLSRLGRSVVARMNELRMLIDISHCGDRTSREAIVLSTTPCVVTHAGCRALWDTGRNKSDDIIRTVAERGGYFGVFNMTLWLTGKTDVSVDTVVDHIDHAVKVGGVDHIGFGSDSSLHGTDDLAANLKGMREWIEQSPGVPGSEHIPTQVLAPDLNGVERMQRLADALGRRGHSDDAVEKIIGGNFARVFGEVCG